MTRLDSKVAIITGASSGIGRAAAILFARQGAKLVLSARGRERLDEVAEEIRREGGDVIAVPGDVSEEAHHQALVEAARAEFGGTDIAFNNAGTTGPLGPLPDLSVTEWQGVLDVNLTSGFLAAKYQLPAMEARGGGSIVFTSTFVGYTAGFPGLAAYAASKSGLVGLVQVLAAEYGPKGIRVNALLPGATDTPMGRHVANTPEALEFVAGLNALKRIAQPEEIARAALFLCSDASSFTTGTAMLVDAGVSINRT
ncbi:SDR family oxidoreductase [Mycoplana dimorpha]|uniref:NAD(P)-dependent dehydrogenase (Short-subunit alcohol dehydrogenase family) n=1 Tax=Mycoplana dimorpha TaxID=28320 RepID=A0A2T5BIV0_MYCDI|nr:SDR family oxidoreductase [Mycoplana dimorpha]PTM98921.1 NAD(P)-dependent dehydrogenase (short-subunit alcohol dehydrogenase family) [Mycoplana dimorpha]